MPHDLNPSEASSRLPEAAPKRPKRKLSQLAKRLLSSAVLIAVTSYAIFFSPGWFFFLVVEMLILLGLNEFFVLAEKKGIVINRYLGLFFGGLLPFSFYFSADSLILMMACLSFFVFNFDKRLRSHALLGTAVSLLGIVYVAWFFSYFMKIRHLPNGPLWVFYTILLVKGGDAGAYFLGTHLGRIKLSEHISPHKSLEGAIGGFVTTLALSFLSKLYLPQVDFVHLAVLGIAVGILAQLGDLAESLIKRDAGVKDSGAVPGLGGMLDVLDSLLFSVPFVYYYLTTLPGVIH